MMKFFLIFSVFALICQSIISSPMNKYGYFSSRVSRINFDAELIRLKLDFSNRKYIVKKDRIYFYNEDNSKNRCEGIVIGKSVEYILVKVQNIKECDKYVNLTRGAYLKVYSSDLIKNIKKGKKLFKILMKKN